MLVMSIGDKCVIDHYEYCVKKVGDITPFVCQFGTQSLPFQIIMHKWNRCWTLYGANFKQNRIILLYMLSL